MANGYIQNWGSLANSTEAVKKADLEKVQSFFSKVTAQKEKSLRQSHEIKAGVYGLGKITILQLCIFVLHLLLGTDLLFRKFFPFPFFVHLIIAHIPILSSRERSPQLLE